MVDLTFSQIEQKIKERFNNLLIKDLLNIFAEWNELKGINTLKIEFLSEEQKNTFALMVVTKSL